MAVTYRIDQAKRRIHTLDGCAIVASRDALFGMARMFEVFAENYLEPVAR
jgi:hypothetical protein